MNESTNRALRLWLDKVEFLRAEEAILTNPSERFAVRKQIEGIYLKIAELKEQLDREPAPEHARFDVFLSHNSIDKATARRLGERLKQRHLRVWLDEWELAPGRPWQEALEKIIQTTRSAAVLFGKAGLGPWEEPEMRACLSEFVARDLPVIPVLLPGAPSKPELPLFLKSFTWVDLRSGLTGVNLDRLIWGITGQKPDIDGEGLIPSKGIRSSRITEVFPTVGLPEYTYVEPDIYDDVTISIDTAGKHLLLQGPSGSGKTILIRRILSDLRLGEQKDFTWLFALDVNCATKTFDLLQASIEGRHQGIVVIDDVHLLEPKTRATLAMQLKQLSDCTYGADKPTTFILIGIPTTAESLLLRANDLGPRLEVRRMPLASDEQLLRLIHEGEKRLSIRFKERKRIVSEAGRSFCLCQNICLNACRKSGIRETQEHVVDVPFRVEDIRQYLVEQLSDRFLPLLIAFCKQGKVSEGFKNPFLTILRLLSANPKQVVRLTELLSQAGELSSMIEREKGKISDALDAANNGALNAANGGAFRKLLHYDEQVEVFSIEDPMIQYYLRHMNIENLLEPLGCLEEYREFCNGVSVSETSDVSNKTEGLESREDVFFSYSHKDKKWFDSLLTTLAPLVRGKTISVWWDGAIKPGERWREEIRNGLKSAKVGVLLVSRNFLASDFINDEELPFLLEAANQQGVTLIWVLVGNCLFDQTSIVDFQAAHDISHPLNSLNEADLDNVLVEISRAIADAAR